MNLLLHLTWCSMELRNTALWTSGDGPHNLMAIWDLRCNSHDCHSQKPGVYVLTQERSKFRPRSIVSTYCYHFGTIINLRTSQLNHFSWGLPVGTKQSAMIPRGKAVSWHVQLPHIVFADWVYNFRNKNMESFCLEVFCHWTICQYFWFYKRNRYQEVLLGLD